MNMTKKIFSATHDYMYYIAGILFSLIIIIPYIVLGTGSIVVYHDQLDGELINYILGARYLFKGVNVYPEIMNGLPSTGAVPPAPLFVLFYFFFSPFNAFIISQWFISLVGFLGMYLLIKKLINQSLSAFFVAIIFMILPFYPVYGLCIPGQPMLIYAILRLQDLEQLVSTKAFDNHGNKRVFLQSIGCLLVIIFYSFCSSLVLVGFACLLALGVYALSITIKALCRHKRLPYSPWISLFVLLFGYLGSNLHLIKQVLFPSGNELSHKAEFYSTPVDFIASFKAAFYPGISYTECWPVVLLPLALICVILYIVAIARKSSTTKKVLAMSLKHSSKLLLIILFICVLFALDSVAPIVQFRNSISGALSGLNLGRVVWLMPTIWCIMAGWLLAPICQNISFSASSLKKRTNLLRLIVVCSLISVWGIIILLHSPLKANISKLIKGNDYYALDWEKFYASDIFEQIDNAIDLPKDTYQVASLGIYPAVAVYNGFYCIDGYSNNYPLSYKHTFREIINNELEKSEYIRLYFDNWGNRCYLLSSEYPAYYTIEKKYNPGFHDLSINTDKLKEMGCDYIFSATWIENAEKLGLELLRKEPFTTDTSWYNIYVYKINR